MRQPVATTVERKARLGRHVQAVPLAVLIIAAGCTPAMADANVSLDFGMRFLDERTWGPLDSQWVDGVRFDYARTGWPVRLAIGLNTSEAEATTSELKPYGAGCLIPPFIFFCLLSGETIERTVARGSLKELSLGVDKDWVSEGSKARAFVGGGVAVVRASIEDLLSGFSARDSSTGLWAHAGILRVDRPFASRVHFDYGVELKMLQGTHLDVGGARGDVDYFQIGLIAGIGWSS